MVEVPKQLSESVRQRIVRDMQPSLLLVYLKCGAAVILSGLISLLVCGQFGVGVTHAAHHLHHQLHSHISDLTSALATGAVFALLAPFILKLLCSPLQFRYIARRGYHAALVWFVGLGGFLAHHGDVGTEITTFVAWSMATFLTFQVGTRLIDTFAPNVGLPSQARSR